MLKPVINSEMPVDKWLSMIEFDQTQPDDSLYLWLSEYGSMTRRLIEAGLGSLRVNVISSQHKVPFKEENLFLCLPQRRWSYIREVLMHVDNSPWVYGRTVIPDTTINGGAGQLKLLGEKPLGKVLFDNNKSSRIFIEVAKISSKHQLYPECVDDVIHPYLWARRSLFNFRSSPLLVQEVFLPDCPLQMPL